MSSLPMLPMASRFKRVQQWQLFMRYWHVIDANCQDAYKLTKRVGTVLSGKSKPIWHPETDCGDHVVVVNCRHVAMHGFDWKHTRFHFDRRYPRSKRDIEAYQIHNYDPCRIVWMLTMKAIRPFYTNNEPIRTIMPRLHLFPDLDMPDFVRRNIGNQLEQIQSVPKKSTDYTPEELAKFPRLKRYSDEHVLDWHAPLEPKFTNEGAEIEERFLKMPNM